MSSHPVLLTKNGFQKLTLELNQLEEQRVLIVQKIDEARKLGDLSENAEYKAAREEQKVVEKKLAELSFIKANAQILTLEMIGNTDVVKIGAKVDLEDIKKKTKKIIFIVSNYESNIENGFISIETPIAQKMIGKAVDDTVLIGANEYLITKITYNL